MIILRRWGNTMHRPEGMDKSFGDQLIGKVILLTAGIPVEITEEEWIIIEDCIEEMEHERKVCRV